MSSDAIPPPAPRGFGALPLEVRRALARKGGIAAGTHRHKWTSADAREAGRLGGIAAHAKRRARESAAALAATQAPFDAQERREALENLRSAATTLPAPPRGIHDGATECPTASMAEVAHGTTE